MRWQLQYLRSLALASLPFQRQLRALKRHISGIEGDPTNEPGCISDGLKLIDMIGRDRIKGATVLELGSGWQPLIPLLFQRAGAARVIMTDDKALMDEAYFNNARQILARHGHNVTASWSDFDYRAPCDWSKIPDASIDVIWSRACLEHIPPEALRAIFRQFRRILRPNGVTAHVIDNSDHWEHKDKSISRVNFLKFSDTTWRIMSRFDTFATNRLRHSDYLTMFRETGFELLHSEGDLCEKTRAALSSLTLNRRFHAYDSNDLAIVTSEIVARPLAMPDVQPKHVHAA